MNYAIFVQIYIYLMKVLWLASWYPNKLTTLNGDFIQRQAQAIPCESAEIIVLHVCAIDKIPDFELVVNVQSKKNPLKEIIVYYPNAHGWLRPVKLFRFYKAHKIAKKYLKSIGWFPEIVHVHVIFPAFLAQRKLFRELPFIISEHYGAYRLKGVFINRPFFRYVTQKAISLAAFVLALNESMVHSMERHGLQGKYRTLPNVVDTDLFYVNPTAPKSPTFRFLHISNMIDSIKNVSGILKAFSSLAQSDQEVELMIVGDGPDKQNIIDLSNQLNLTEKVTFLPNIPHPQVASCMQSSDAFILFSNYEGLPCVLLEAMACGLPTIATETGGIADWVHSETGILIPPHDELALLSAMQQMIQNSPTFDRNLISSLVHQKCSYPTIAAQILEIYQEVLIQKS